MKVRIPENFFDVKYVGSRVPGAENQSDLSLGANCQVFAYELLKVNGLEGGNERSSELWDDETYSKKVDDPEPLDIFLYSRNGQAFGAHVGVYIGDGKIIHLSLDNGKPEIVEHSEMLTRPKYTHFVGAKRILNKIENIK